MKPTHFFTAFCALTLTVNAGVVSYPISNEYMGIGTFTIENSDLLPAWPAVGTPFQDVYREPIPSAGAFLDGKTWIQQNFNLYHPFLGQVGSDNWGLFVMVATSPASIHQADISIDIQYSETDNRYHTTFHLHYSHGGIFDPVYPPIYQTGPTFATLPTPSEAYQLLMTSSLAHHPVASDPVFGVATNQFGFTISGTRNMVVVVEATTNLVNPIWSALQTNTLSSVSSFFSDPVWTNYPARFYRLRSP